MKDRNPLKRPSTKRKTHVSLWSIHGDLWWTFQERSLRRGTGICEKCPNGCSKCVSASCLQSPSDPLGFPYKFRGIPCKFLGMPYKCLEFPYTPRLSTWNRGALRRPFSNVSNERIVLFRFHVEGSGGYAWGPFVFPLFGSLGSPWYQGPANTCSGILWGLS